MATTGNASAIGDLKNVMQGLLEQFKPGGTIEQNRFAEAEHEGRRLQANLAGHSISRGLGNAALGIPTQVHEAVSQAKNRISSELSGQYLGVLTNLMSLAVGEEARQEELNFRKSEAASNRSSQRIATQAANKQSEREREAWEWQKALEADKKRIADIEARRAGTQQQPATQPQASQFPALYQAAGYGQGTIYDNQDSAISPEVYGMFEMTSATNSPARESAVPISYGGYGPMFQDESELANIRTAATRR